MVNSVAVFLVIFFCLLFHLFSVWRNFRLTKNLCKEKLHANTLVFSFWIWSDLNTSIRLKIIKALKRTGLSRQKLPPNANITRQYLFIFFAFWERMIWTDVFLWLFLRFSSEFSVYLICPCPGFSFNFDFCFVFFSPSFIHFRSFSRKGIGYSGQDASLESRTGLCPRNRARRRFFFECTRRYHPYSCSCYCQAKYVWGEDQTFSPRSGKRKVTLTSRSPHGFFA